MPEGFSLRGIEVDVAANTLSLQVGEGTGTITERAPATIDVGTGGRLVGVELPSGYIDVMMPEAGTEHLTRSAETEAVVERAGEGGALIAVTLPRHGTGYEITYPSGNQ